MTMKDLTPEERELVEYMREYPEIELTLYCMALHFWRESGKDPEETAREIETLRARQTRGDFKRTIRHLREGQAYLTRTGDPQGIIPNYEGTIAFIRRELLQREARA